MNATEVIALQAATRLLWPHAAVVDEADLASFGALGALVLADITAPEAQTVIVEAARAGEAFPPTLGQIAERVLTVRELEAGTLAPDADQAWAEVSAAVRRRGAFQGPPRAWSHPAVADTAASIGWTELCMSERPDVVRSHFKSFYELARARRQAEQRRTDQMRELIDGAAARGRELAP